MRKIKSFRQLEEFGGIRLSQHFYMRDFMYSEISNHFGVSNIPDDPSLAVEAGRKLCSELLDPLANTFGPISVRSAYQSPAVNGKGNEAGHNCANNDANRAGHIWDQLDRDGKMGATACIVIPWFADQYSKGRDWRDLAWWLHDHLPYSRICFHPNRAAFNLSWHEVPKRQISSYIKPKGILLRSGHSPAENSAQRLKRYESFPTYCGISYPKIRNGCSKVRSDPTQQSPAAQPQNASCTDE